MKMRSEAGEVYSKRARSDVLQRAGSHARRRAGVRFRHLRSRGAHVLSILEFGACGRPARRVIETMYCDMDRFVGEAMSHIDRETAFFVLSDHGFCWFRRGVNLNSWLRRNGYLTLQDGEEESGEYFKGIDWSQTRAYTFGLGGLYLNLRGCETQGVVDPVDAGALKTDLMAKLFGIKDDGEIAVPTGICCVGDLSRLPNIDPRRI